MIATGACRLPDVPPTRAYARGFAAAYPGHHFKQGYIMAKNETRRLAPDILGDDLDALTAVEKLPDYRPSRDEFRVDVLVVIS